MNTLNRFHAPFLPSLVTSRFRFEQGAATVSLSYRAFSLEQAEKAFLDIHKFHLNSSRLTVTLL